MLPRVAIAALLLASPLVGCGGDPRATEEAPGVEAEALRQCVGTTVRGVDVSYYQGRIDWPSVKASGVAFAFARVADGEGIVDARFGENWAGMKAAGVLRGGYQFFRPAQDPVAQAQRFIDEIDARGGLQAGDLPPVLDVEVTGGVSHATLKSRVTIWLQRVEAALHRTPIVYTDGDFWNALGADASFGSYGLWIADRDAACPTMAGPWSRWRFWQDADHGKVPGIDGAVDTDQFAGTLAELQAFAGAGAGGASCVAGAVYCGGNRVPGTPSTLYRCHADGSASAVRACARGCAPSADGRAGDACR